MDNFDRPQPIDNLNRKRKDFDTIWFFLIDTKNKNCMIVRRGKYSMYYTDSEAQFLDECKKDNITFIEADLSKVIL